jgi:hypothetical protein
MRRRYVVKMVTSWPGSSGPTGASTSRRQRALFDRREVGVSPGRYSALLLIDRQEPANSQIQRDQWSGQNGRLVRLVSASMRPKQPCSPD